MSARAGIVVTGTEVLTGRVSDRNGPWLAERLRELGVDLAHIDDRRRPARGHARGAARSWPAQGIDLVLTSGGLGPTADDLTAEVVGRFQGREMVLDEALEERIAEILRPLRQTLAEPRHGGDPRRQPQAGDDPAGRGRARAGRHRARAGRAAAGARRGARPWSCCRGRRASCSRCGQRRCGAGRCARRWRARRVLPPAHAAPVRDPRVGDRRDAARGRARGRRSWSAWRSRPA